MFIKLRPLQFEHFSLSSESFFQSQEVKLCSNVRKEKAPKISRFMEKKSTHQNLDEQTIINELLISKIISNLNKINENHVNNETQLQPSSALYICVENR